MAGPHKLRSLQAPARGPVQPGGLTASMMGAANLARSDRFGGTQYFVLRLSPLNAVLPDTVR